MGVDPPELQPGCDLLLFSEDDFSELPVSDVADCRAGGGSLCLSGSDTFFIDPGPPGLAAGFPEDSRLFPAVV